MLVTITARKAYDLAEREGRLKRGGGQVRGDSALLDPAAGDQQHGWEQIAGNEPTPEFAAQAVEEYRRLLGQLADDELRSIAVWKMEGLTHQEIAARLGCAIPTVERRLRRIRKTWAAEVSGAADPFHRKISSRSGFVSGGMHPRNGTDGDLIGPIGHISPIGPMGPICPIAGVESATRPQTALMVMGHSHYCG